MYILLFIFTINGLWWLKGNVEVHVTVYINNVSVVFQISLHRLNTTIFYKFLLVRIEQ